MTATRSRARLALPLAGLAVLALVTGACSGDPEAAPSATATTATTADQKLAAPASETTSTLGTLGGESVPGGKLLLRPTGLSVIEFGTSEEDAVARLTQALGPGQRGPTTEVVCPGRTMATWTAPGVTAYFSGGRFDGWKVVRAGGAQTAEGIAVGSPVTAVRTAYEPKLSWMQTPLGAEFSTTDQPSAPAIAGVANVPERPDDTAHVQGLWAGNVCNVR
jgi:hypothetical protein